MQVVVVSPIQMVRAGLRAMLQAPTPFQASDAGLPGLVVSEAASLAEVEGWLDEIDVLVITADSASPASLQRLAARQEGRLALLLLTDDPQAAQVLLGLPLRCWGVLALDSSSETLHTALGALHEGLLVGSPELATPALSHLLAAGSPAAGFLQENVEPLTQREMEVLQLVAQGLANKQIAVKLGISEHTVKFHVSAIVARLGVANRTEAVRVGIQQGLVSL
jgi:DNA-binding NarL/FixJ family response regulator